MSSLCRGDCRPGNLPFSADARWLVALVDSGKATPDELGGADNVAELRARPDSVWCLSCGRERASPGTTLDTPSPRP